MANLENIAPSSSEIIIEHQNWESFGSEVDVEKERTTDTRPKMKFSLKRRLKDYGKSFEFADSTQAEIKKSCVDFAPCEDKAFNLHMTQQNKGTQIVIELQDATCQTFTAPCKNVWIQYAPREFTEEKRMEILETEGIKGFLNSTIPRLQDAMEQSEIFDVFKDDFEILGEFSKSVNTMQDIIKEAE